MLMDKVIKPPKIESTALVMFCPKKERSLRFCVDYRKLNTVTVRELYTITSTDECTDCQGHATVLSTREASSNY